MRLYGRIVYASALFVGCCLFLNGVSAQNTPSPSLEGVEIEMNLTHVPKGTEVIFGKNLEKRVVDSAVVSDHTFRVHVGKLTSMSNAVENRATLAEWLVLSAIGRWRVDVIGIIMLLCAH